VARERKHDGSSERDQPVTPESILKLVFCGCKAGCGKACGCWKLGLHCTSMCVSVKVKLVNTWQLLAMKTRSNKIFNDSLHKAYG